jgi:hypothetical protein
MAFSAPHGNLSASQRSQRSQCSQNYFFQHRSQSKWILLNFNISGSHIGCGLPEESDDGHQHPQVGKWEPWLFQCHRITRLNMEGKCRCSAQSATQLWRDNTFTLKVTATRTPIMIIPVNIKWPRGIAYSSQKPAVLCLCIDHLFTQTEVLILYLWENERSHFCNKC